MDIEAIFNHTKICSDLGSEHIYIRNIPFKYNSDETVSYNGIELDSYVHNNHNLVYVNFKNIVQLRNAVGFKNFYILNQIYKFDPSVTTDEKSILLFSSKTMEELGILIDAMIDVYKGKTINNSKGTNYIYFRLGNNCSISMYFNYVYEEEGDKEGYIIELIHNQCTLYKQEFKAFVADFTKMIED